MKIIGLPLDISPDESLKKVFILPDSALQKGDRPFFIPYSDRNFRIEAGIAVKICKVGKPASARFSNRYYDSWTPIVNFVDEKSESLGFSPAFCRGFNLASSIGEFHRFSDNETVTHTLEFILDGSCILSVDPENYFNTLDESLYLAGHHFSLRTGDLFVPAFIDTGTNAICDTRMEIFHDNTLITGFNIK